MSEQEKKWREEFESYWIDNVEIEGNASPEWIADAAFLVAKRQDAERIAELEAQLGEGTTGNKYRAELYDEVWSTARRMGFANVSDALAELAELRAKLDKQEPDGIGS